jgi:hypothetical protein
MKVISLSVVTQLSIKGWSAFPAAGSTQRNRFDEVDHDHHYTG